MVTMATRLETAVADISQMRGAFVLVLVDADADAYLVSREVPFLHQLPSLTCTPVSRQVLYGRPGRRW